MGPNEVDIKDLQSLPNASVKDGAAPAIQKYAEPPKAQVFLDPSAYTRTLLQASRARSHQLLSCGMGYDFRICWLHIAFYHMPMTSGVLYARHTCPSLCVSGWVAFRGSVISQAAVLQVSCLSSCCMSNSMHMGDMGCTCRQLILNDLIATAAVHGQPIAALQLIMHYYLHALQLTMHYYYACITINHALLLCMHYN